MNAAITQLIKTDFVLQWRYRIIAAYAFVIALYAVLIVFAGSILPSWVIALFIFSDPAVFGFFFLGGLMMLEKGENVRAALAISPASTRQYLFSKIVSLTAIALVAVLILSLVAGASAGGIALVLFATICISVAFTSIGAIVALRFKTVNGYLIGSVPFILPLIAPAAALLFEPLPIIVYALPPVAQVKLLLIALGASTSTFPVLIVCSFSCIIAAAGAFYGATQYLQRELGSK